MLKLVFLLPQKRLTYARRDKLEKLEKMFSTWLDLQQCQNADVVRCERDKDQAKIISVLEVVISP